ncbi:MAG TPA: acetolactate synthase small subunit [Candidatus Acidoferrales bacterium]|jgi:acetolactate synthase-1/3 small subunit|nr:acetolactate synthase small subunit [Candidatus Acidoferrales bacterium]
METDQTKVISVLVENKPGVLHGVANLFRRRNFNIESITVGLSENIDTSRMTITVKGDEKTLEQVVKQLAKLIDVLKVEELEPGHFVMRELALIKVNVPTTKDRSDIINCVEVFRGRIIDVSTDSLTVEITGTPDKLDAFLKLMQTNGIIELARTGITALARGAKTVRIDE